jgi:neutral ceramidase
VTGVQFEGRRSPVPVGEQGHKLGVEGVPSEDTVPEAVPLLALRVDDRLIVSYPGEPTAEVGRRLRAAVERSSRGSGVRRVVVSGYANEYLQYFTTPEEYERQHYEGGSTLFGPRASVLLQEQMAELASRLVDGRPAQPAYPFDPTNGLSPTGGSFGPAAAQGVVQAEPRHTYRRLREAKLAWHGAPLGHDRPLDKAFVTVERRTGRGWRNATNDLGLEIVWRVDDEGNYRANWEIPLNEPRGPHRFRITARRYTLVSRRFKVRPSRRLQVEELGSAGSRVRVALGYPDAKRLKDFTFRPARVNGGRVRFKLGGESRTVRRRTGSTFGVSGSRRVTIPNHAARDRFGNRNRGVVRLGGP